MFCPQCGTWNRASLAVCVRCTDPLPELPRAPFEQPPEEITRLRRATGNRYRVLHRLGGGGMAEVYVAEQVQLGRRVVIKVLHPLNIDETELRRLVVVLEQVLESAEGHMLRRYASLGMDMGLRSLTSR